MFTFPAIKLSKVSWKFLNLKQFKICEVGTRVEYKSWHYTNFTCNHETLKLLLKIAAVNMIRKVFLQKLMSLYQLYCIFPCHICLFAIVDRSMYHTNLLFIPTNQISCFLIPSIFICHFLDTFICFCLC